jgi:hypothetical protein
MSTWKGKSRAQRRPLADSQTRDIRQLIMQQPGYRPILPSQAEGQTFAGQDESGDVVERARYPIDLF